MKKTVFYNMLKNAFADSHLNIAKGRVCIIHSSDEMYDIIIRLPNMTQGFILEIIPTNQPMPKIAWLRCYDYSEFLWLAEYREYSEEQIRENTNEVIMYAQDVANGGIVKLREYLNNWGISYYTNEVLAWLGLPEIDAYSNTVFQETISVLKHGGFFMVSKEEYLQHKLYYDQFLDYGFHMKEYKQNITISYLGLPPQH